MKVEVSGKTQHFTVYDSAKRFSSKERDRPGVLYVAVGIAKGGTEKPD